MADKPRTLAMGQDEATAVDRTFVDAPFGQALVALGARRPEVVGLTADLGKYTDILPFRDAFPERFFNIGMAEQNLVAVAAGLARTGKVPFATTYGVFATRRAYDFIAIAVAHSRLNVKIVAGLPGLTTGYGGTHQAIEDLALMRMVPGLVVIDPCDATDIAQATEAIAAYDGPVYMRLLRGKVPVVLDPAGYRFAIGKAVRLRGGKDVGIISTGLMTERALDAAGDARRARHRRRHPARPDDQALRRRRGCRVRCFGRPPGDRREPRRRRRPCQPGRRGAVRTRHPEAAHADRHPRPLHRVRIGAASPIGLWPHQRARRRDDRRGGLDKPAMRITSIETFTVGAGWKNWLFVKVNTDEGLHGIGEGTLNGFIRTTEAGVRELEHLVIGEDPLRVRALARRLLDSVSLDGGHIHRTIIAAIEVACWDILGKSLGVPVHQLLGGRVRDSVLGYANGWYRTERTPEAFLAAARGVLAKGFKAFKLDPFGTAQGFISEPELALAEDILRTLRDELPADTLILIDVHARFTEAEAIRAARRLAPLGIYWWEEPTTRDRQETVHAVAQAQPDPGGDRRDVRHGRPVLHARGGRRRQHLPARADVARRHRQHACRRRRGARPRQLHRAPPERRPGRDRRLPAARRLRAQLPHPGAFRRLQRALDPRPGHLASDDRPERTGTSRCPTVPGWASTSTSRSPAPIPTTRTPISTSSRKAGKSGSARHKGAGGRPGRRETPAADGQALTRRGARGTCYIPAMTKLLDKALARVRELPEDEQDGAAGALIDYLDGSRALHLTDDQVAEVVRRKTLPRENFVTMEEARARLHRPR